LTAETIGNDLGKILLDKARENDPDAEGDVFVGYENNAYWVNPRTGSYRRINSD